MAVGSAVSVQTQPSQSGVSKAIMTPDTDSQLTDVINRKAVDNTSSTPNNAARTNEVSSIIDSNNHVSTCQNTSQQAEWNINTDLWDINDLDIYTSNITVPLQDPVNNASTQDPLMSTLHETRAKNAKNLIILHVNINSLKCGENEKNGAYDYIMDILNNRYADILCVTETKLNKEYKDTIYENDYYKMHRKDKTSSSGGMIMWVRSDIPQIRLKHREFDGGSECHIESMVIDLKIRTQSWHLLLVYKNPKVSNNRFLPKIKQFYDAATLEAQEVILLGDINIDMQHGNDEMTEEICGIYGLSNLITKPTCFKTPRGTLLDPVIVTSKNRFHNPINVHCGYSDFHNMVGCVTKLQIPPQEPRVIKYRSYKNFSEEKFKEEVNQIPFHVREIFDDVSDQHWFSTKLYRDVLDNHAPTKERTIRNNQLPYMHSELRKNMYRRNMLKNKAFKYRTSENFKQYHTQRNKVTAMRRDAIRTYFRSKNSKDVSKRDFWNLYRPFLSDKSKSHRNIILNENGRIIADKSQTCEILNEFFSTIAESIGEPDSIDIDSPDYLQQILSKHENHPSVQAITSNVHVQNEFEFHHVSQDTVHKMLNKLKTSKATGFDELPPKVIKMCSTELTPMLTDLINTSIDNKQFPDEMKKAEISPIYKKENDMLKDNYRPVSILTIFSKVYECILADQLKTFFEPILNKLLCAYRKKYGCDHVIVKLVDAWKWALDKNQLAGAILMDLSKAFDCIPHALLICKLRAYGLSEGACKLMASYLTGRLQRVKISNCTSTWRIVTKGVPQGSRLGPDLFNIFMNDIFWVITICELANYADDNTLSKVENTVDALVNALRIDTVNALEWFIQNFMQANPHKFQAILMKSPTSVVTLPEYIEVKDVKIRCQNVVKLLGIYIDDKLKFTTHIDHICSTASTQLKIMYRFKKVLTVEDKTDMYRSFVLANFNYCPIVWHYCDVNMMRKMEKLQERALRYLLNDHTSDYQTLLFKSGFDTLHLRRIKAIACEVFKSINDLNPSFVKEMFEVKETRYNLRSEMVMIQPKYNKLTYGYRTFSYYGAHLWNKLPHNVKGGLSYDTFKMLLNKWEGPMCSCSLCNVNIYQ